MPDSLENIAVPLDGTVDALSDVLEMIHLRGGEVSLVRAGQDVRHASGARVLHVVMSGSVGLDFDADDSGTQGTSERIQLDAGDLTLLAVGRGHRLSPGGEATWISGAFVVEENVATPLLQVLPPAIVIHRADDNLDWLPLSARLLAVEITSPSAGSQVMVSRILDLLFIQTLRTWASRGSPAEPGWLTAALDRAVGPALRVMHRQPEMPWYVDELAAMASMSRAAFSARFARLVGEPPGRYLCRLRLARAADALAKTSDPVGSIGRAVGYTSEAAFSRAFSREYDSSPRAWRTARQQARE